MPVSINTSGGTTVLTIAVPGVQGPPGSFRFGAVSTGPAGSSASGSVTTDENGVQTLYLTIPRGDVGSPGPVGPKGDGYTWQGTWATATSYSERDVVVHDGSVFLVIVSHVSATAPTPATPGANYVLWARKGDQGPPGSGATDATTTAKGSIMLAGDLAGTADAPTVPAVQSATSAATANTLAKRDANGVSTFSTVKLSGVQSNDGDSASRKDYVDDQVAKARRMPNNPFSTNFTLALADEGQLRANDTAAGATVVTIPTNATVTFPVGSVVDILRSTTYGVTITASTGVILNWKGTGTDGGSLSMSQHQVIRLHKVASNTWYAYELTPDLTIHNATPSSVADTIVERDANAQFNANQIGIMAASPLSDWHAARKDYVDKATHLAPINYQTNTAYTFAASDMYREVDSGSSFATTFTIPANASVAFPIGTVLTVVQFGTGAVTIAGASGVTVLVPSGYSATAAAQNATIYARKRDLDSWELSGELLLNSPVSNSTPARKDYVDGQVSSRVQNVSGVARIRKMTQAEYDALASKDSTTLYVIVG